MKNPNGYGSIIKLHGQRRRPWAAVVTVASGVDETGKFHQKRKYIGYYATKAEALHALDQYHQNPARIDSRITFAELYERWAKEKYPTISVSVQRQYTAAYKAVPGLHGQTFATLQPVALQQAIDDSGKNPPTQKKIVTLYSQLYQYASFNRIIPNDVNPAHLLHTGKMEKSKAHHRFNQTEVHTLWEHADNEYVQVILMMIYTGVRPGELFALRTDDVHLDDQYFYIRKAKNETSIRVVPIHRRILPFFQHWADKGTEYLITTVTGKPVHFDTCHPTVIRDYWSPLLQSMGIYEASDAVTGETFTHKPHDCRHTFASMWADAGLNEMVRRRIMGHTGQGIGEQVYTHLDIQKLVEEVNKLE